jgi:hypothetical protein
MSFGKFWKNLKTNKTRDPWGMINEIFKPGVLFSALWALLNESKSENVIPLFMWLANITSIFVLTVIRGIPDWLLYNDLYPEVEENMSNSNIGALKNKNVHNHLFIVHGIINSVVKGEAKCIDIQIYNIKQAFDALWLQDCMNDLYDSLPATGWNDKLSLLYNANCER